METYCKKDGFVIETYCKCCGRVLDLRPDQGGVCDACFGDIELDGIDWEE